MGGEHPWWALVVSEDPEKLLSSDLAFESFPGNILWLMADKTSEFQSDHLKDPVCQDVWGEGVDGHLHWLSAFRTQELRLLLIDVLIQQLWSAVSINFGQPFPSGLLTFRHFVQKVCWQGSTLFDSSSCGKRRILIQFFFFKSIKVSKLFQI